MLVMIYFLQLLHQWDCHIKNMTLKLSDTRWAFSSCNNFA
ncbi:conserved hypothetical protein (plasmid) [Borreliella burgdorferi WI91-23]|nr:conserved hypothetical protein [Borreliella burgdorferi WI91-23]